MYTVFWTSKLKIHLPSQNFHLSQATGLHICPALLCVRKLPGGFCLPHSVCSALLKMNEIIFICPKPQMSHLMRKGTLACCGLKSYKCTCPATQKGQGCGSVWSFLKLPLLCEQTAKALLRLRGCAGAPEPSLFVYVISTLFSFFVLFLSRLAQMHTYRWPYKLHTSKTLGSLLWPTNLPWQDFISLAELKLYDHWH